MAVAIILQNRRISKVPSGRDPKITVSCIVSGTALGGDQGGYDPMAARLGTPTTGHRPTTVESLRLDTEGKFSIGIVAVVEAQVLNNYDY